MANSNFYVNIGVNAGFTRSRSNTSSHTEGAAVTTLKPMNENSSITYNNINSITYQGTQAQGGTFIYNNVANIQKEAVELHNSYSSSSSSRGINAGATIGYGHKIQTTGNGGSISSSRSNQNTVETIYANGNFKNVNEVHNNTGSMVLNGFNQEGGKVTGNIGKVEVISRQNTSTTTGSSRGISVGVSANGVPSSVNVSRSRTNGNRAFVDNQSTFIVGEESNLHVGTLENTGAVVGKEGNSTFKADKYIGHDLQNTDTMKTTGGSIGISTEKPRITNVGFNQDSRDKQGITRNTVIGDVEIGETSGSPINRDITRANEVTKDTHSSTNINVESQTIEYAANPAKLKEDIGKAKKEISDVKKAIKESINDRGDDNRNFFGQLREVRLSETVNNIAGKRLTEAQKSEDVVSAWKDAYKDLGYNLDVKYTTGEDTPEMKDKAGTAYVSKDGVHTIIININAKENSTKAGLIGTLAEEASHIVNGVAGRQIATGTEEKGLESTGRAANAYFQEEYKGSSQNMTYKSDGKIDTSKLGTNVGDEIFTKVRKEDEEKYLNAKQQMAYKSFFEYMLSDIGYRENGIFKAYSKDFLNDVVEKLNMLVENEVILKEINETVDLKSTLDTATLKKLEERGINGQIKIKDIFNLGTEDVLEEKDGQIKIKNKSKDLDIVTEWYRIGIEDKNNKAIIKITEKEDLEKKEIKEFFRFFEEKVKSTSAIPEKNKQNIINSYKKNFEAINQNMFYNDSDFSIILINKDEIKYNYPTFKFDDNGNPISLIANTSDNIATNIAHETGHFIDKIKGNLNPINQKNVETYIHKGKTNLNHIFSTTNYTIDEKNKTIIFYPRWDMEYNSVLFENEVRNKIYKGTALPRITYKIEDLNEKIKVHYDANVNINEAFKKMMNDLKNKK